jgi:16S rRNA (cytosine1402-N4)-methyltransferase
LKGHGVAGEAGGVHQSVMLDACIEGLAVRREGVYVDATFGRGGHSARILSCLGPQGRLVALDRDPAAVCAGQSWSDPRFTIVRARFSELSAVLDAQGIATVDGVLFDLGVSSPQLDEPSRGFSFRADGPLDMRMDPESGCSAREWLLGASEADIARVLSEYGEERFAVPIAKAIVACVRDAGRDALPRTVDLAALVAGVIRRCARRPEVGKDPATRTFQALRILVNQELEELACALPAATARLAVGGRLVVLAFHSLEDRMVKQFMARESGRYAGRDPITGGVVHDTPPRLSGLVRRLPETMEVRANPRARSAVLRSAQRA